MLPLRQLPQVFDSLVGLFFILFKDASITLPNEGVFSKVIAYYLPNNCVN